MERNLNVAAAVIIDGDRILACQRGHGELAGGWEFPGGKVEPGETPAEACVREIAEELAVQIADLRPFVRLDYDYPSFHMHLETFTCRIVEGTPKMLDHVDLRWVSADDIEGLDWLPADVQVANALRAYLVNSGSFVGGCCE